MRVSKWGNSLALRLPAELVQELGLKPGDDVNLVADGKRRLRIQPGMSKDEAIALMKKIARPLPADYKFDREEINERR